MTSTTVWTLTECQLQVQLALSCSLLWYLCNLLAQTNQPTKQQGPGQQAVHLSINQPASLPTSQLTKQSSNLLLGPIRGYNKQWLRKQQTISTQRSTHVSEAPSAGVGPCACCIMCHTHHHHQLGVWAPSCGGPQAAHGGRVGADLRAWAPDHHQIHRPHQSHHAHLHLHR